jgi:phthalate 4,5-dioxygenase reductase subunit
MAAPVTPSLTLQISRSWMAAEGIRGFELRRSGGGDLPAFEPGAHIGVRTPNGSLRKYSLCNDPAERDRYEIAVLRETAGRGGSAAMVDDARDGADIEVAPPHNDFPLVESAAGHTFIAGGIGITPILSMIRHLKSRTGSRFKLYYCTRNAAGTAFRDELSAPEFRGQVVLHHDGGDPSRSLDLWPVLEVPRGHVYCCGPRGLMQAVRDMSGHWSPSAVHFEAFAEPQQARPDDRPFRVRLARSNAIVEVPVGTTILEAVRASGHEAASSCESGTCGTCRTKLLAGEPDHRDLVLADHERAGNIMICVSRAMSDELVLDR